MTIALLLDSFGGGGKERRCLQMIKGLNEAGYNDIHVVLLHNRIEYPDLLNTSAKIYEWSPKNTPQWHPDRFRNLYKILMGIKPDILMTWTFLESSFYFMLIKPFFRCKYICAAITTAQPYNFYSIGNIVRMISLKQADVIVSNSQAGLDAYKAPIKKSRVYYNGFDPERLKHLQPINKTRKLLGIKTPYLVSMAARFQPMKDYPCFIKAAQIVLKKRKDVTFMCIGKGETMERCQLMVMKSEQPYIQFPGFRKDVDSILNASDISVLCTNNKEHKEGVSNTILESMAYGVPVIATGGGGTDEIMRNNKNGYVIEPYSHEQLAEHILMLLEDDNLRNQMGKFAQKDVLERFSLKRMTDEYVKLFKEMQ